MGIITRKHDDVVELTLDWPEKRNALGPAEGRELRIALEVSTADPSVRVIAISANGKAFCAGGDLPEIVRLATAGPEAVRSTIYGEFQGVFRAIRQSPIPVIAAVDGAAVGFGCDLCLAGNITFMGERAWLAQGWMKAGLIPATGGTFYVAERGGESAVWKMLATDRVNAVTAQSWGLAIACSGARAAALEMAAKFATMPRAPLRALTQLSRAKDYDSHLKMALEFQTGFITDPEFPRRAAELLAR